MSQQRQLYTTTEKLAEALGEHVETVRRKARRNYFKGQIGGGRKPFKFLKTAVEKQYGWEPGSLA